MKEKVGVRFEGDVLLLRGRGIPGREVKLGYEHVGKILRPDGEDGPEVVMRESIPLGQRKRIRSFTVFGANGVDRIVGATVRLRVSRSDVATLQTGEDGSTPDVPEYRAPDGRAWDEMWVEGLEWWDVRLTLPDGCEEQDVWVVVRGPLERAVE